MNTILLITSILLKSWQLDIISITGDTDNRVVLTTKDNIRITIERAEQAVTPSNLAPFTWPRDYARWYPNYVISNGFLVPFTTNSVQQN